jgi:hypothetical protein
VSRVKGIKRAFRSFGKAAYSFVLAQGVKFVFSSGYKFMRISLMTDIPNEFVRGRVKDIMKGQGQFDYTQTWGKVPPGL